jgi:GNAT superfamily N-acetyltransferase
MARKESANLLIRAMRAEDLDFAVQCTATEGWQSENRTSLEGFFLYDPKGCFIAEELGKSMGICVATSYGKSAFIGELIVRPEARGRGIGASLLNHGVAYLRQCGTETVYLDGVVKAVDLYERNGFHKICRSWRLSGSLAGKPGKCVRRMRLDDLEQVFALDRFSFGADRSIFLKQRLEIYPELSLVVVDGERVTGYISGREGEGWLSAGPCVVSEGTEDFIDLFHTFALQAGDRLISVGILETNTRACEIVRSLGFVERPDSPWRMALGNGNNLGASPECFAIGSAAKG